MEGLFKIPDRACDAQVEVLLEFDENAPIIRRELYERAFAFWKEGRYTKAGSFMAKYKIEDVNDELLRIEVTEGVPILFGLINYVFTIKSEVLKPKPYEAETLEFHIRAMNVPMTKRFVSKFTITPVIGKRNSYRMWVGLWIETSAWARPFAYGKTVDGWKVSHTKCIGEMKNALQIEMGPTS